MGFTFSRYALGLVALILLSSCGCSKSLVYSPTLNLPSQPLKKHTFQIQGGAALLPEARPKVTSSEAAWGMEASIRYAVSDQLTLQFHIREDGTAGRIRLKGGRTSRISRR
jgi:hypothetical protein